MNDVWKTAILISQNYRIKLSDEQIAKISSAPPPPSLSEQPTLPHPSPSQKKR